MPPTLILILLSAGVFLSLASVLMLGPLLIALADEFHISLAMAGQLAAAPAISWAMAAPLVGPFSDVYGKRGPLLVGLLLMALGVLGAAFTWNYDSMLALRLLGGIGAAMVPPNSIAMIADVFPSEKRGRAIGWLFSASGVAAALGMPLVALLLGAGGWQLPFYALGAASAALCLLCWLWLPRSPRQPTHALEFFSHYRAVGANATVWYVLVANALQRVVFFGMFAYLAAHLIETYGMAAANTAIPLALAGSGGIVGGFVGGRIADHRLRLRLFALSCIGSGILVVIVFMATGSVWITAGLACGVAALTSISLPVTPTLIIEFSGSSRTTAAGLFAVSNQIGAFAGPSLGGLMLALGGYSAIGLFCLGVSVIAAVLVRLKVRDSVEFLGRIARRQDAEAG
jgi:predicted MFS family arabinose efflux permease